MKIQKGFSLIEIMIAVVIIGILSAFALPAYREYVTRGRLVDPTSTLSDAKLKMDQYYQDNHAYNVAIGGGIPCTLILPTAYFGYACVTTPTTFTITATGIGSMLGFTYSINQANAKATVSLPATWGAANPACWIITKGGMC